MSIEEKDLAELAVINPDESDENLIADFNALQERIEKDQIGHHQQLHRDIADAHRLTTKLVGKGPDAWEEFRTAEGWKRNCPPKITKKNIFLNVSRFCFGSASISEKDVSKRGRVLSVLATRGIYPDEAFQYLKENGFEKLSQAAAEGARERKAKAKVDIPPFETKVERAPAILPPGFKDLNGRLETDKPCWIKVRRIGDDIEVLDQLPDEDFIRLSAITSDTAPVARSQKRIFGTITQTDLKTSSAPATAREEGGDGLRKLSGIAVTSSGTSDGSSSHPTAH